MWNLKKMWSRRFSSARCGGTIFWSNLTSMEWITTKRSQQLVYTPTGFCTNVLHFLIWSFFFLCLWCSICFSSICFPPVLSPNLPLSSNTSLFTLPNCPFHLFLPQAPFSFSLSFSFTPPSSSPSLSVVSFSSTFPCSFLLLNYVSSIRIMTRRPPLSKCMSGLMHCWRERRICFFACLLRIKVRGHVGTMWVPSLLIMFLNVYCSACMK